MKKARFTETQIIGILKEADAGKAVKEIAKNTSKSTFLEELWLLIRDKKKYWLLPIVVILLFLGALVLLSGTAVAPFIYTLF